MDRGFASAVGARDIGCIIVAAIPLGLLGGVIGFGIFWLFVRPFL